MSDRIKDKVADAGHSVADAAKQAVDWAKEKTGIGQPNPPVAGISERMDVIASCGKKVGVVDHVEGGAIKLTRKDSPDGEHHYVPVGWVDHVDTHVHLKKNSMETEQGWKSDSASCGCT